LWPEDSREERKVISEKPASSWSKARERMLERIEDTARRLTRGFPNFADPETGEWTTSPQGDWTGGHWVGELWLARRATGEERYGEWATRWCEALRPRASSNTIFRGFLFYYGAALGDVLLGNEGARDVALQGARGLLDLYNPEAGVIPLGTEAEEASDVGNGEASIDAVGSISALFGWASEKTGDGSFRDAALRHAQRHMEFCVRNDASVCQSASFDPGTGEVVRRYSHKGYSEDSTWARAQAWGMLAYTLSAHWMPECEEFLETAVRVADWWLEHIPEDRVAFWDFADPGIPDVERDTSATAIAAASLLKLAQLVQDDGLKSRYRDAARETVRALVEGYLTPTGPDDQRVPGILTEGCYNKHIELATRDELIWGDYYLFEALQVLDGKITATEV
jgi:unsaturated chondroitin disaccharide hydrolase